MGAYEVRVHGKLERTERLEKAVAKVIVEVRKHEKYVEERNARAYRIAEE